MNNDQELSKLSNKMITYKTKAYFKNSECPEYTKLAERENPTLTICEGARVMLTINIDVSAGLVNGAIGTVI